MKFFKIIDHDLNRLKKQIVCFIGGGGKSSLIQKISKEIVAKNFRVIITTTTKMQALPNVGIVLKKNNDNYLSELKVILDELKIVQLAHGYYKKSTLSGIHPASIYNLLEYVDIILIEADGSRQRSLKTHKEHEPVIPVCATTVIILGGANIVGAKLNKLNVHRADLFAKKWELPLDTVLTPEIISKEMLSPHSYLKNIPISAKIVYYVNKTDKNANGGKLLAQHLFTKSIYPVFLGSIAKNYLSRIGI